MGEGESEQARRAAGGRVEGREWAVGWAGGWREWAAGWAFANDNSWSRRFNRHVSAIRERHPIPLLLVA